MFNPHTMSVVDRVVRQIIACQSLKELDRALHSTSVLNISLSALSRNLRFKVRCILSLGTFIDAIKQQGNMEYVRGLIADQLSQFNEPDEMQCSRAICDLMDNIISFRNENLILLEFRRIGELLSN